MIRLEHVTKRFSDTETPILHNVNFYMKPGELCFLEGSSGSGKTTLLRLLMRDLVPDEGAIYVNGKNLMQMEKKQIPYFRRNLGVVFQDYKLIENKTIFENVALTRYVTGGADKNLTMHVYRALRMVGMENNYKRYPEQLSGGEQQRVAIARALVGNPSIILADEPTRNLDSNHSREIMQLLVEIHKLLGLTMLIATHDEDAIVGLAGRVFHLTDESKM